MLLSIFTLTLLGSLDSFTSETHDRGLVVYDAPDLCQVQDAAGQELPCLPCQGVEGGEARARQPGERILTDQGSQTEVHLIIFMSRLCWASQQGWRPTHCGRPGLPPGTLYLPFPHSRWT